MSELRPRLAHALVAVILPLALAACGSPHGTGGGDGGAPPDGGGGQATDGGTYDGGTTDGGTASDVPVLPTGPFVSPLGIPKPAFGIDEPSPAAPSGWPDTAVPDHYYVDMSSAKATDTDNPYGTPALPRATFPPAHTFPAGTVIELHGGVYDSLSWLVCNGTKAKPCFIRGASRSDRPVVSATLQLRDSTYTIVENIDFKGGTGSAVSVWGHSAYVAARYNLVRDKTWVSNSAGFGTSPQPGDHLHDIVFYRNAVSNLGDWTVTATDPDFHGFTPGTWGRDASSGTEADHIWVLQNTCYHLSGNCVQVNAGNGAGAYAILHHVYVGGNISGPNRQAGFWCKQATDVIFSQNVAYGGRIHGSQPGGGGGYQYNPDYVWFIFNDFYDNTFGVRQSDTSGGDPSHTAFIVGNYLHDNDVSSDQMHWGSPTGWGITLWQGNQTRYVVDNTIVNTRGGIELIFAGPTTVAGNVIATSYPDTPIFRVQESATAAVTTVGANLFYAGAQTPIYTWGSTTPIQGLSAFQTASGQCSGCIEADPKFTDAAGGDLSLAADSPGRDTSARSQVYAIFEQRYGISIDVDHDGNPRPAGGGWDFGAYER